MIIDDEPLVVRSLARLLRRKHEVVTTHCGPEGLALLTRPGEAPFDMILCDLMMPDLSGMDIYDRLRSTAPELQERFVFMTGGAFTETAQDFISRISNDVVDKPLRGATIDKLLERWTSDPPASRG